MMTWLCRHPSRSARPAISRRRMLHSPCPSPELARRWPTAPRARWRLLQQHRCGCFVLLHDCVTRAIVQGISDSDRAALASTAAHGAAVQVCVCAFAMGSQLCVMRCGYRVGGSLLACPSLCRIVFQGVPEALRALQHVSCAGDVLWDRDEGYNHRGGGLRLTVRDPSRVAKADANTCIRFGCQQPKR